MSTAWIILTIRSVSLTTHYPNTDTTDKFHRVQSLEAIYYYFFSWKKSGYKTTTTTKQAASQKTKFAKFMITRKCRGKGVLQLTWTETKYITCHMQMRKPDPKQNLIIIIILMLPHPLSETPNQSTLWKMIRRSRITNKPGATLT